MVRTVLADSCQQTIVESVTTRDAHEFGISDAHGIVSAPKTTDDKYSRGVVGFVTGSLEYPGAAVLGVSAAYRAGVGMVRYVGPETVSHHVLERRPEVVLGAGRVSSWVIGSGIDEMSRTEESTAAMRLALASDVSVVVDAGALDLVPALEQRDRVVITPHSGELSRLMTTVTGQESQWTRDAILEDPRAAAARAANALGVVVCLKGHVTHIAALDNDVLTELAVTSPTTWLATAGTGDVLAGIMGAVIATFRPESAQELARCAAAAAFVHGRAASVASAGGPIAALDVAEAVPAAIREVLNA